MNQKIGESRLSKTRRPSPWQANLNVPIELKPETEMVGQAAVVLNQLSNGATRICCDLIDGAEVTEEYPMKFQKYSENQCGATYSGTIDNTTYNAMWICPMTLAFWDHYPEVIYIKSVRRI